MKELREYLSKTLGVYAPELSPTSAAVTRTCRWKIALPGVIPINTS